MYGRPQSCTGQYGPMIPDTSSPRPSIFAIAAPIIVRQMESASSFFAAESVVVDPDVMVLQLNRKLAVAQVGT